MISLFLWAISFIYTLPVYNKYWAPFDEGIIAVAAQRLMYGELPYKDFFIVMYPPGQIYAVAAVFKTFSDPLIAGRIYAVFVSVVSAMLVFYMAKRLTKNTTVSVFAWLIALTSLAPRLGALPTPIWPGMLLGLLSIYIFMNYLENERSFSALVSGLVCGIAITFRHDIGIFALAAIMASMFIRSLIKRKFGSFFIFTFGAILTTLPWILYFIVKGAGKDMYESLIAFTFVHAKTAALPFPMPCFDLNRIFHGSLEFISINQFYIPMIVYVFIAAVIPVRLLKRDGNKSEALALLAVLLFGVFTFNQARIRTDPAHLLTVIEPAAILFAFIIYRTFFIKAERNPLILVKYLVSFVLILLFALLLIKNMDKYLKNCYTKAFKKNIVATSFEGVGTIYLPKEERQEVLDTVNFIKANTGRGDRIYVGNMAHWKDDFGGSIIIYYLTDRLPSTKFYELLPGLITNPEVQKEIADSLGGKGVKFIVLQDVDIGAADKDKAPAGAKLLDDFIQKNYIPKAKFGKYNIYIKKR